MAEQKSPGAECAEMGALAEAHGRLKAFEGKFSAKCSLWMGPGDPMVTTGVMENTLALGGRFLRQDYTGDPSDGPFSNFEGRGYWGYNTVTKKYEGFWIDTASTSMQNETGDVDAAGKVWTMVGRMTDPQSGKPMTKRSVITLQDDDHHQIEMFFQGPDGNEFKAMEIKYTRKT